jgi:hypothetical protein
LSSYGDKSFDPDGFNFAFFKRFWSLLKVEVGVLFVQIFVTVDFPRSFSFYFITLIPNISAPLSGSLYKIVAKVLARRLTNVMNKLISKPINFY